MKEKEAILILNAIPGIGNATIPKLIDKYGSAANVLSLKKEDFLSSGILKDEIASNILSFPKEAFLEDEIKNFTDNDIKIITYKCDDYPEHLKSISDFPVVLYVKGGLAIDSKIAVAIVGSRKSSIYGNIIAQKFARSLSEMGITVISGMARGIDTSAHIGALKVQGKTIAVLGSGLNNVYPPENKKLFDEIAVNGAVISEFPMETKPLPYNFPRRNRIISGLSLGVIVVEAANKSGALITADFALEQGKEVFAVPGKIDSPTSYGVNNLIKQGAKLVTCVEDVLEELKLQLLSSLGEEKENAKAESHDDIIENLSDIEQSIFRFINETPQHVDELVLKSKIDISQANSALIRLELKRVIEQLPGKLYKKR